MDSLTPAAPGLRADRLATLARLLWAATDRTASLWFALAGGLVLGSSAVATLGPWLLKRLVDGLSAANHAAGADALLLAAGYVAALAGQRLAEQAQAYAYGRAEQRVVRRLGARAYGHMLRLPLATHVQRRSGALAQTLTDGALGARLVLTHAVMTAAPAVMQLAMAASVISLVFGLAAGLLVVLALGAYALVFGWSLRAQGQAVRQISAAQMEAGGVAADGLMNVEALKVFTAEGRYTARYETALGARELSWRRYLARRLEAGLVVSLLFLVLLGGVTLAGADGVARGRIGVGGFVLLNAYVLQLVRPLEMLGFALRDLGQALAYLGGLLDLFGEDREADDAPVPTRAPTPGAAEIVLRDVAFDFGERGTGLRSVSFRAPAGSFIGIVGPSGAGKSTLLRLLLRLYEPTAGAILLDGRPIRELPLPALREQVALVSQDTILLHDTIRANIALAADAPPDGAIERAARTARLDGLLASLPRGLDTAVGERGLQLSGGEKQRVSIARAALRGARVVLFDEATAALDPATEREVWQAMRGLAEGATILAVTHRLSTVVGADEILVLDKGEIVERGRHENLMARGGLYAGLWRSQAGMAA